MMGKSTNAAGKKDYFSDFCIYHNAQAGLDESRKCHLLQMYIYIG